MTGVARPGSEETPMPNDWRMNWKLLYINTEFIFAALLLAVDGRTEM